MGALRIEIAVLRARFGRQWAIRGRSLDREGRERADLAMHGDDGRAPGASGDLGLRDMIFREESLGRDRGAANNGEMMRQSIEADQLPV